MKRFTCGHSAGVNANTTVQCAACELKTRCAARFGATISHTISEAELKYTYHPQASQSVASLVADRARELCMQLEAAGLLKGSITITLDAANPTKEG